MKGSTILRSVFLSVLVALVALPAAAQLTPLETLGKALYFDRTLSSPSNQSCAVCHGELVGFTGPTPVINKTGAVYPGAVHQRFGNRRPPTASYAGDSPVFHFDTEEGLFAGGMFWDGRATGWVTGDPLADQAMGPYLNPVEQNLPSEEAACMVVAESDYVGLYEEEFGPLDCSDYDSDGHLKAYKNFAIAVAAFERSEEVSPFNSKFDYVMAGEADFTAQEAQGWELFNGKAMCSACHPDPMFTDFTYDNLGVPKNPDNPFYEMDQVFLDDGSAINPEGDAWVDRGLAGFLDGLSEGWFASYGLDKTTVVDESEGKHKVPTLRNVDKRPGSGFAKAYMHNGSLKSLEEVVAFFNNRDAMIADGSIVPEVMENMNVDELGDLGLSKKEEAALVAFMKTLSDGYQP